MAIISCDALIVGAGFAGIYQLKKLLDLNLAVILIDAASDVGGTWLWNSYPGAASDTESYLYRYSWDKDDLLHCPWEEHYVTQPEVLSYLRHVVDRYDLRRHMRTNVEMTSATFDETSGIWKVKTSKETVFRTRYLVTGLGLLSKQNFPDIPGLKERAFDGELYHTGAWPKSHDFTGKRVAVIGNGSTGVQLITAIASEVAQLTCFQRSPQYSVPNGNGPVSRDYREMINRDYDQIWSQVKSSAVAFGFEESKIPAMSVSEEERERKFQAAWDKGNGFRFMFWTFCDITYDVDANEAACKFIRQKIAEIVYDPEKARKLTPTEPYARRPLCDGGYYQQFNRRHVDIVELKKTPIAMITPRGIKTSDGIVREFEVIVFATGFDAVDGNYTRLEIKGRKGRSLRDHWATKGPVSYLGMCVAGFPNLFMLTGPNGPFTNIPPTIETQVEFISDIIGCCEARRQQSQRVRNVDGSLVTAPYEPLTPRANGSIRSGNGPEKLRAPALIEVKAGSEDAWTDECERLCENSLFKKTDSWIFGANVPGKKNAVRFYFGGLGNYRAKLKDVREEGYREFELF